MKVRCVYFVAYMSPKGLGNTIVQAEGGVRTAATLQTIVKHLAKTEEVKEEEICLLNWKRLPGHDTIVDDEEVEQ